MYVGTSQVENDGMQARRAPSELSGLSYISGQSAAGGSAMGKYYECLLFALASISFPYIRFLLISVVNITYGSCTT